MQLTTELQPQPARTLVPTALERTLIQHGFDDAIFDGYKTSLLRNPRAHHYYRANIANARATLSDGRFTTYRPLLTPPSSNPKMRKSARATYGLTLCPNNTFDWQGFGFDQPFNACPYASPGCMNACLHYSGKGAMSRTQYARQLRMATMLWMPYDFGWVLGYELGKAAHSHPDGILFRFNVVTDIRTELVMPRLLTHWGPRHPFVQPYDYTAWPMQRRAPINTHLTFSAKETTSDVEIINTIMAGYNVAIPFDVKHARDLPHEMQVNGDTVRVVDGTRTDDRTLDPEGVIVGLVAKRTPGRTDSVGFLRTP